jgi:hypothetical protein
VLHSAQGTNPGIDCGPGAVSAVSCICFDEAAVLLQRSTIQLGVGEGESSKQASWVAGVEL